MDRGAAENKTTTSTSAPVRQKNTHVRSFISFCFWCGFGCCLGKESKKNARKEKKVRVQDVDLFTFFLSTLFIALVKRLSVRGTQN
jgi:hypothetical protein